MFYIFIQHIYYILYNLCIINRLQKKIKKHIWLCCEICWIMILSVPILTFNPNKFRYASHSGYKKFDVKNKHDLSTGSKKINSKIIYYAMPAIQQPHFVNSDSNLQIIKGTVFAHNDQNLIKYVMSDPDQL